MVGSAINITKKYNQTKRLIKQGVAVEYIEEQETIEKEENDYSSLTVKELKEILEQKGLSTKGKKAELIERLKEN